MKMLAPSLAAVAFSCLLFTTTDAFNLDSPYAYPPHSGLQLQSRLMSCSTGIRRGSAACPQHSTCRKVLKNPDCELGYCICNGDWVWVLDRISSQGICLPRLKPGDRCNARSIFNVVWTENSFCNNRTGLLECKPHFVNAQTHCYLNGPISPTTCSVGERLIATSLLARNETGQIVRQQTQKCVSQAATAASDQSHCDPFIHTRYCKRSGLVCSACPEGGRARCRNRKEKNFVCIALLLLAVLL